MSPRNQGLDLIDRAGPQSANFAHDRLPTVLFVSKPIGEPFRDGTKCLVRDLARACTEHRAVVMGVSGQDTTWASGTQVRVAFTYRNAGSFATTPWNNARAAWWLATQGQADVWHFVFAPNPASCRVGRWLSRWRRVPVVQTIASPPRSFVGIERLLFGQVVVAGSDWTRRQILAHCTRLPTPPLEVIPPPVPELEPPSPDRIQAARQSLGIPSGAPLFVYPGDLETSVGTKAIEQLLPPLWLRFPDAVVVLACRAKTRAAPALAQSLRRRLDQERTRVIDEIEDLLALLAGATAVLFPVDDLTGKVDLPIVLLESMAIGTPVVVFDWGPLGELGGAIKVRTYDQAGLLEAVTRLVLDRALRESVIAEQLRAVRERHLAPLVGAQYERLYRMARLSRSWA